MAPSINGQKIINKTLEGVFWELKLIEINLEKPFILASNKSSPIYIDCRKIISHPVERNLVITLAYHILHRIGLNNIDVIAGGESAGIPFAAWLARQTNLPMIYIRKKPKGYGKLAQIEGILERGQKVLLFEDLITDGRSKENFYISIKKAGATIEHCLVIFDREQGGEERLAKQGIKLHAMTRLTPTLKYGLEANFINQEEFEGVEKYLSK